MSTSTKTWPVTQYHPRHSSWPYNPSDFDRQDPSSDSGFYSTPRFVTHIDDAAIATLREYYDTVLPRKGRVLDFCSSWVSHYPSAVEQAAASGELKVTGMGMNKAELDANKVLNNGRVLADLNDSPEVAAALRDAKLVSDDSEYLDASTNVVSTDYLTQPVEVLKSLRSVTKNGGKVHLIISNRCFPTKAIRRWLQCSEDERLQMIGDYLHFAGWKEIEIVELSNGKVADGGAGEGQQAGNLQSLMGWMGMNHRDPLWVVRATKT
ncbi:hypothetical protein LTR56_016790 [Elasticomyces elasticus]|nr:hypothetical protein LTR22_021771 [Elasticomyces elasticus]KAK3631557.1 hypothetical protein LTR56_016790 [Elasticomyces elasticus]KAK4909397.1 hypothetical protein LTR49_021798 [Elasticomyces elasticus]KAK5749355.1 hypothetical protein LTS12_020610 [Elasticomyces elasticus]